MQSAFPTLRQVRFWGLLIAGLTLVIVGYVLAILPAKVNGDPSDLIIRFLGMVLQLFGAATVWYNLIKTARDFGIKKIFITPRIISGSINITEDEDTCSIRASVHPCIDPKLTTEKRLTQLENYVKSIDSEWITLHERISELELDIFSEISKETFKLQQAIDIVMKRLKDAFVGNYDFLKLGMWCLVIGIMVSSFPVEITCLVEQFGRFIRTGYSAYAC